MLYQAPVVTARSLGERTACYAGTKDMFEYANTTESTTQTHLATSPRSQA
jgi:hypothetical protein